MDPMQPVKWVSSFEDVEMFWRWLSEQDKLAFDTETTGVDVYARDFGVRLVQFGSVDDAWVIDFPRWIGLVSEVFRRFDGRFIGHNTRFDISALATQGVQVPWHQVDDTMIMMRLARPTESAALKNAADKYVSTASSGAQTMLKEAFRRQKWDWDTVPIDWPPYAFYAALDTILTARLEETDVARQGLLSPVYPLEMQVRAVCTRMEQNGMMVDAPFCIEKAAMLRERAAKIKDDIHDAFDISVGSSTQLAHWFASQSDAIPLMTKETAGGKLSVDKEILSVLSTLSGSSGDVARAALAVRRDEKIASAYLDNFIEMRDDCDIIHPSIETIAARTGRMSVREPGLQTLPKPTVDSDYRMVREAIIPRSPDRAIISADYDQIELRLSAHFSKDPGLIEAFRVADSGDTDFFTQLAREVYHEPGIMKGDKRRDRIKTFSYASLYGASVRKMAISAGVPVHEMRETRDGIAARYPGFFSVMLEFQHQTKVNGGFIETLLGRKLPITDDKEYVSTNFALQGSAADILKRSIVNLAQAGLEEYMLLPVHDEIVFDAPIEDADEIRETIRSAMLVDDLAVPLTCSPSVPCINWADAK